MLDDPTSLGEAQAQEMARLDALYAAVAEMLRHSSPETRKAVAGMLAGRAITRDTGEVAEMERSAARHAASKLCGVTIGPIPPDA